MTPLVTVYIPTKNRLSLLRRAVDSVLKQTESAVELIVVSDGSDDGTCDYVQALGATLPVRLIHNATSLGACSARNQAIEVAHGRFVTGLDDDDFFMPNRIARFLAEWQTLEAAGTRFSCLFDSRLVDEGPRVYIANSDAVVDAETILASNAIGNQVFTTRENMLAVGMFDPLMPAWQDWETWVRLVQQFGPAHSIQAKTYYMDVSHEFERITAKSPDKILHAAQMFYAKHCSPRHRAGLLSALETYPQVRLTMHDLSTLLKDRQARLVARKLLHGKYSMSMSSSLRPVARTA